MGRPAKRGWGCRTIRCRVWRHVVSSNARTEYGNSGFIEVDTAASLDPSLDRNTVTDRRFESRITASSE